MSRKHAVIGSGLLLSLAICTAGMSWSFSYIPNFYLKALDKQTDPKVRKAQAKTFVQRTLRLVDDINHAEKWSQEFTEEQVNSWLAEDLPRLPQQHAVWLPEGMTEPRIHFTDGIMHVAFRYSTNDWETVVSCQLRPWVPSPNRLAIEFSSVQAGLVPIPMDEVLAETQRLLTEEGWQIEWAQSGGNDVIIVDLGVGAPEQSVLESIHLEEGSLSLFGQGVSVGDKKLADLLTLLMTPKDQRN